MIIQRCYKNILKELFTISLGLNLHEKKKIVKNKTNFYIIKKAFRNNNKKSLRSNYKVVFYSPFSSTFLHFPYASNF